MLKQIKKRIQVKVLNYLIRDVMNFVTTEDLLLIDKRKNVIISDRNKRGNGHLKAEAKMILESELYSKMINSVYHISNAKASKNSKDFDDVMMSKAWLFFTEYMTTFLKEVANTRDDS